METTENHKDEILESRKGSLGSSDASLVLSVAKNGCISESQRKRLAIMLNMDEQAIFSTEATAYGNKTEDTIYLLLKQKFPNLLSNPRYTYERSKDLGLSFDIINHIDYEVVHEGELRWYEAKSVNDDIATTMSKYKPQLQWHHLLLNEKAEKLGLKPKLFLVHYLTKDKVSDFDPLNVTVKEIPQSKIFEIDFIKGLAIIQNEVLTFKYEKLDELNAETLPDSLQDRLNEISDLEMKMQEIKVKVDTFKQNILKMMLDNNVKKISNNSLRITLRQGSKSMKLDTDALKENHYEIYNMFLTKEVIKAPSIRLKAF